MPPPTKLNCAWVADITYLPLQSCFAFLALVLDLCSRRVVGWNLADHMTEPLVLDALQHSISDRQPPSELIHHSDRSGQYAGHDYRAVLRRVAMRQSMSRAANCYDNAFMESCFGTIKTELEMTAKCRKIHLAISRHRLRTLRNIISIPASRHPCPARLQG